jgi:hypothetical protein
MVSNCKGVFILAQISLLNWLGGRKEKAEGAKTNPAYFAAICCNSLQLAASISHQGNEGNEEKG